MPHFCPACFIETAEEIGAQSREKARLRGERLEMDTHTQRKKDKALVQQSWARYESERKQILGDWRG